MAGNMGNESVTVKNLKVLQVDEKNGIVVVNGCVPGPKGQVIRVSDALGKKWPEGPMSVEQPVEVEAGVLEGASEGAETGNATATA